jgi:hypothetical protein
LPLSAVIDRLTSWDEGQLIVPRNAKVLAGIPRAAEVHAGVRADLLGVES